MRDFTDPCARVGMLAERHLTAAQAERLADIRRRHDLLARGKLDLLFVTTDGLHRDIGALLDVIGPITAS